MAAEIYASAAGTIAQIWILSELFPRKQSVKKVYIVGWILLNFCIAHFVLLPNIWQSLLGMGVMLLMSCIMLEGKTEQKMLVIIVCNVFMILVSMLRGRITFFLSGESINEISIQGSESLARVLGIVLTNTLYLVTAYILTRFFHDKIKLKKEGTLDQLRQTVKDAMSPNNTRDEFRQLLKAENIDAIFRINPVGRIYGVTFIDHNKGIVANGSVLGKEFSANVFNELYPAPKEVRQVAERQAEQKHEEQNHAANPISGIVDTVLDLADTRAYEEQQRLIQRRKKRRSHK
mgnify:CR=1 FL=1